MTDMVSKFNVGVENVQHTANVRGFKKGVEALNLAAIFRERGITFDNNNEK